ncbi:MAG: PepSY domain-containing protein [Gemmatimonadetes bacterium]|nr:PepSY domain-containing protein [Gemmatimonadota bacterium]
MQLKSLLGAVVVAASVAGAQAPAAATKAQAPAATKEATKAPAAAASYKKEVPAKLAAKAKVAEAAAAAIALASVPGGKIEGVELEEEDGAFIYSYDIKIAGKKGVEEVHVDAMTGKILKSVHEDPTSAKEEAAEGKKEAKKVPAPVKKP